MNKGIIQKVKNQTIRGLKNYHYTPEKDSDLFYYIDGQFEELIEEIKKGINVKHDGNEGLAEHNFNCNYGRNEILRILIGDSHD